MSPFPGAGNRPPNTKKVKSSAICPAPAGSACGNVFCLCERMSLPRVALPAAIVPVLLSDLHFDSFSYPVASIVFGDMAIVSLFLLLFFLANPRSCL